MKREEPELSFDTGGERLRLRRASNADVPQVQEIVFGTLEEFELDADPEDTDADLRDLESAYLRPGGEFYVLEREDGSIGGCIGLMLLGNGIAELRKMYLLPELRGCGIGRFLLDTILARARELGVRRIELESSSRLVSAIHLYEKYGFTPFTPDHMVPRADIALALDLNDPATLV